MQGKISDNRDTRALGVHGAVQSVSWKLFGPIFSSYTDINEREYIVLPVLCIHVEYITHVELLLERSRLKVRNSRLYRPELSYQC